MKMLKRIFIGALCLAVLISCFAVFASAKDYTTDNFKDILEYYDAPYAFNDDFEGYNAGDKYTTNIYNPANGTNSTTIKSDGSDKYLNLNPDKIAPQTKDMYLYSDFEDATDNFVITTIISGTSKNVTIWLCENGAGVGDLDDTTTDIPLVELHLGASSTPGAVKYYKYNPKNNEKEVITMTGVTVNNTDKFEVTIVYNGSSKTYSISVTSLVDETKTATVENIGAPMAAAKRVKIGSKAANLKTKLNINLFELKVYAGTFVRDMANKQTESEKAIAAMYDAFVDANATEEQKLEIVTIAGKMAKLGFTTTDTALADKLNGLLAEAINFYTVEIEKFATGFGVANNYQDRAAYVAQYADYFELLPEDLSPVGADKAARIEEIVSIFNEEKTTLESYKTNSEAFIAALEGANAESTDYVYLRPIYDAAVEYVDKAYSGYPGIPEALKVYKKVANVVEILIENADTFIAKTALAAADGEFAVRYAAYVEAKAAKVDNETYPGVTEALASFTVVQAEMTAVEEIAFEYISYAQSATYARYIPAQEAYIVLANSVENVEPQFPGISEAKAALLELEADIAQKKADAAAYIEAVEALEGKTGAALEEAIAAAKALQAAGSILGIDGIEKANIALSSAESAITSSKGYAEKFNNLVTQIGGCIVDGKLTNTAKTREVILSAISICAKADDSLAGVSNNKDILNKAIADYNAVVNAANAAFADVCGTATGVTLSAAAENGMVAIVGKVIAFIKELV